jgi:hypothetical protein
VIKGPAQNAHERQNFRDMSIASIQRAPFAHMLLYSVYIALLHSFRETAAAADKGKRVSLKSRLGARLALNTNECYCCECVCHSFYAVSGAASVLVKPIWQRNEGQILLFAYLLWMSTSRQLRRREKCVCIHF